MSSSQLTSLYDTHAPALFRYRTAPDGSTFRLWSVGRNGKDDTGTKDAEDDWSFSTEALRPE